MNDQTKVGGFPYNDPNKKLIETMELLIALMISLGTISADEASMMRDDNQIIDMAISSGIDESKIEDAKSEIIGNEEVDF